jgi:OmpA-OmpF porin, OOP family
MAGPTGFRRLFSLLAAAALAVPPGALAAQATDPGSAASSERVDLLSWAAGAFVVRADPAAVEGARAALDGDDRTVSIGIPRRQPLPHVFVVELPAVTTFETFGVPEIGEFGPARGRHIGTIRIEGSTEGPETGFVPLATLEVQVDQGAPQHFPVAEARPARWIRVRFETRILPPPTDVDPFTFAELVGYGRQEPIETPGDRFTGSWRLRRTGINDVPGINVLVLTQNGAELRGCQIWGGQRVEVVGNIVDGVARLVFDPTGAGGGTPVLARVTSERDFAGARMTGSMIPMWATWDPDVPDPCPVEDARDPIVDALEAGSVAILYGIHFDLDSDQLRPDATPALERLLEALEATGTLGVTIEGHTDSEGSEAHNLDLSLRRAEAVAAWLTTRGIDPARLEPVGKGEAEPVADNASSAGRALNRRVEVAPKGT